MTQPEETARSENSTLLSAEMSITHRLLATFRSHRLSRARGQISTDSRYAEMMCVYVCVRMLVCVREGGRDTVRGRNEGTRRIYRKSVVCVFVYAHIEDA